MSLLGLIFDLDGTLIDSAPDIRAAVNAMLAEEGIAPLSQPIITGFIGNGLKVLVERVVAHLGLPEADLPRLQARTYAAMEAAPAELTMPYPGVVAALTGFAADGRRMAICTNKPEGPARAILAALDLERFFPVVIGGDRLPVLKPDPAPLLLAREELGSGPVLYIGDSEVDAATAEAAGLPFLLFTEGYRKTPVEDLPTTAAFGDFAELRGLVARLSA